MALPFDASDPPCDGNCDECNLDCAQVMKELEDDQQNFWEATVVVITRAWTKDVAEEKIKKGHLLVNDILEMKLDTLTHLEGESRERMIKSINRALTHEEKHSAMRWGYG